MRIFSDIGDQFPHAFLVPTHLIDAANQIPSLGDLTQCFGTLNAFYGFP